MDDDREQWKAEKRSSSGVEGGEDGAGFFYELGSFFFKRE